MSTMSGNRRNIKQMTWALLACTCGMLLVGSAKAEDQAGYLRQSVVHFADLDLNSSDDLTSLYRRIQNAAKQVCGWPGAVAPDWWRPSRDCIDQATAKGIADINNPALTSLYLAKRSGTQKRPVIAQAH